MQEKRKLKVTLFVLTLISSLFLITSSDSSIAWRTTFKSDYWQTGSMFEYVGRYDTGYHYEDVGIGSFFQPIAFHDDDISNQTILILASTTNYLYAFREVNNDFSTVTTLLAGNLTGQLSGWDKEGNDGTFDFAGIFDVNGTSFFRYYTFNGTNFELVYNFTSATLGNGGVGVGVTCRDYNGVDNCVFIDQNGTLYEVNVDSLSYSSHANLGDITKLYHPIPHRTPVVESLKSDGEYQALFNSDYNYDDVNYARDLVAWDLTNDQLDADFGGIGGDPAGVVINAYGTYPANNPVVAQIGISCSWLFGLIPYNCQEAGYLEILGFAGRTSPTAYMWDANGNEMASQSTGSGVSYLTGDFGVVDCNGDNVLDVIGMVIDTDIDPHCEWIHCFDGSDDLSLVANSIYGKYIVGSIYSACYQGTGIAITDFNNDGDNDIATSSGVWDAEWEAGDQFAEITKLIDVDLATDQAPIILDFNNDNILDLIYTYRGETRVYYSNATNQNPQFIGDGAEVDTCVPLCVNETITFYARKDLDYEDEENDDAYLGVDCYEGGFGNITWSSLATDPEVACNYTILGYWDVDVYITDYANYPSLTEIQTFSIYTSLSTNCYSAGEWQEECDPSADIDEADICFTDSGVNICLVQGVSSALCTQCNCSETANNRCPLIVNGTEVDAYESRMFDWTECSDWSGSMWYGLCPLFIWTTSVLDNIWDWIFGAFWIFLTLLLVAIITAFFVKKRS